MVGRGHTKLNTAAVPAAFCLLQMCRFQEICSLAAVEPKFNYGHSVIWTSIFPSIVSSVVQAGAESEVILCTSS